MGHRRRVEVSVDFEGDGWMAVTLEATEDKGAFHGMLLMDKKRIDVPGYLSKEHIDKWMKTVKQEEIEAEKARTAGPSPSSQRSGTSEISDEELSMTSSRSTTNLGKPTPPRTRFRRVGPRGVWVKGNRTRPSLCTKCRNPTTDDEKVKKKKFTISSPKAGTTVAGSGIALGKRTGALPPTSKLNFGPGHLEELRNPTISPLKSLRLGGGIRRDSEGSSGRPAVNLVPKFGAPAATRSPGRPKNSSLASLYPVKSISNRIMATSRAGPSLTRSSFMQRVDEMNGGSNSSISLNAPLDQRVVTGNRVQVTGQSATGQSVPILKIRVGGPAGNSSPLLIRKAGTIPSNPSNTDTSSRTSVSHLNCALPARNVRPQSNASSVTLKPGEVGTSGPNLMRIKPEISKRKHSLDEKAASTVANSIASTSAPRVSLTRVDEAKRKRVEPDSGEDEGESPIPSNTPTPEENPEGLKVGDIVWAKMPREPYWPAEIYAFNASEDTCVLWLGSTLHGFVPLLSLQRFNEVFKKRYNPKRNSRNYQSAVCDGILKLKDQGVEDNTFYQSLSPLAVKILSEKSKTKLAVERMEKDSPSTSFSSTPGKRGRGRGKTSKSKTSDETQLQKGRRYTIHRIPTNSSEAMSQDTRRNPSIVLEQVFSPSKMPANSSTCSKELSPPVSIFSKLQTRFQDCGIVTPTTSTSSPTTNSVEAQETEEDPKLTPEEPQPSTSTPVPDKEALPVIVEGGDGFAGGIEMEEYESEDEEELGAEEWKGAVEAAANAARPIPVLSPKPPSLSPNSNTGEKDYEEAMSELEAMNRLCPASPPSNPNSMDPTSSVLAH